MRVLRVGRDEGGPRDAERRRVHGGGNAQRDVQRAASRGG